MITKASPWPLQSIAKYGQRRSDALCMSQGILCNQLHGHIADPLGLVDQRGCTVCWPRLITRFVNPMPDAGPHR